MAIQGAVRLDSVAATRTGKLINFKANEDYQNGFVFHAEDLVTGEREVYIPVEPTTASITAKSLYINASVELNYEAGKTIVDYFLADGEVGRGVLLEQGDRLTLTNLVVDGTSVVGKYLIPKNASKLLTVADDLTGNTKFAAKIIELTTIYGQPATKIRVIKN